MDNLQATNLQENAAANSVVAIGTARKPGRAMFMPPPAGVSYRRRNAVISTVTGAGMIALGLVAEDATGLIGRETSVVNSGVEFRPPSAIDTARMAAARELSEYRALDDGWDGVGSIKPIADAIDDALSFLKALPLDIAQVPEPSVSADGTVAWYWAGPSKYVSVLFLGNSRYSYYAESGGVTAKGRAPLTEENALPDDLLGIIRSI